MSSYFLLGDFPASDHGFHAKHVAAAERCEVGTNSVFRTPFLASNTKTLPSGVVSASSSGV